MIVKKESFVSFLRECSKNNIYEIGEVIVPSINKYSEDGETHLTKIELCSTIELESKRSIDPIKILFYLSREELSIKDGSKKRILAGVKNCDLKALEITDHALLKENFVDPRYKYWRDNTIIISSDCDNIGNSCHCSLMGGKPYADSGFDINISALDENYFVSAGSEIGEDLIERMMEFIPIDGNPPDAESRILQKREKLNNRLLEKNKKYPINSISENLRFISEDPWKDESYNCVGCGGCTNICPTCYCIILNDESEANKFVKVKSYDSCQYNGYARVAGGGTPRPKMYQRFRNRYLCKFDYMKNNFNTYGCVGCGRCSDTCPADIDFMSVVTNTSKLAERL